MEQPTQQRICIVPLVNAMAKVVCRIRQTRLEEDNYWEIVWREEHGTCAPRPCMSEIYYVYAR